MTERLFASRPELTEKQFQHTITEGLTYCGWAYNHVFRSQMKDGRWRTTTTAKGFPDLQAVKPGFILVIEVKADKGRFEPGQEKWLAMFHDAGALSWCLRPRDSWEDIASWIQHPERAPSRFGW